MYSKEYIEEVAKFDPILAEKFAKNERPVHQAVWNSNNLSETRDLTPDEADALEFWIHGR